MSRYYFKLTDGRPFSEIDGMDLPDLAAVRREAMGLARDLMRRAEYLDWSRWAVFVTDEQKRQVLTVPFVEAGANFRAEHYGSE
jgi:hypothetical protein